MSDKTAKAIANREKETRKANAAKAKKTKTTSESK